MRIVLFEVDRQRYLGDCETELTDLKGKITVKVARLRLLSLQQVVKGVGINQVKGS